MEGRDYFSEMSEALERESGGRSDDDSRSVDSRNETPPQVMRALNARKHINNPKRDDEGNILEDEETNITTAAASAVDKEAIKCLNNHAKAGLFRPEFIGGYIDLMEQLGAVPKSTDPFVKGYQYNRWFFTFDGDDPAKCKDQYLDLRNRHKANVRYFRYREFAEKHGFHLDKSESGESENENNNNHFYWGHGNDEKDNDAYIGPKLTMEQIDKERQALEENK